MFFNLENIYETKLEENQVNVLPKKEAIELAMETIHSQQKTIAELVSAVAKFSMQFPNNIVKKSEYKK